MKLLIILVLITLALGFIFIPVRDIKNNTNISIGTKQCHGLVVNAKCYGWETESIY